MLSKKEAVEDFRKHILPLVQHPKNFGPNDKVAVRTAWNDYTDSLRKDGKISLRQYEIWSNPFDKN